MPPVATCGRFDNAPAHVILISHRFATGELGTVHSENEKPRGSRKDQEARRIEKENAAIVKADLKKAREAIERLQKMDIMRRKEQEGKRRIMKDVRPGESKSQRHNRHERERLAAKYAPMLAALPEGYEKVYESEYPVGIETVYMYLRRGQVHGVKIGQYWYARKADILAEVDAAKERWRDTVQKNIDRKVARK